MEARHRRDQDNLISISLGVLAFGVWTLVRLALYFILGLEDFVGETPAETAIYVVAAVIIGAVITFVRVYVFLHARAEGRGNPQGWGYVIVTGIMVLAQVASIVMFFTELGENFSDPIDGVVTLFVELTALVTLIELIVSAVRVKAWYRTERGA